MNLNEFFKDAPDIDIEQLSIDSRVPMRNAIFFCLDGIKYNGHNFIDEAIDNGAKVIVYNQEIVKQKKAIYVKVNNVNETLYRIADKFYNHPNTDMNEYVVSGCYGRSSVSSIINFYLNKKDSCGYVGIFGIKYKNTNLSVTFPTLTALDNLKVLNNLKKENINSCVFETSPISLYYKKLDVLKPKVFIYTNTSKFSSDFKACNNYYFSDLRRYLYTLEDNTCVVFNSDDEAFEELKDSINIYVTYGKDENSVYRIGDIELSSRGLRFTIVYDDSEYKVYSRLLGEANVYNLTAAIAALHCNGYEMQDIIDTLKDMDYVEGVLERVDDDYNIIVDCAYEKDNIENIAKFARKITNGKVIGLLGINYTDDDKRIKDIMDICNRYMDVIILTEDESLEGEVMSILAKADQYNEMHKVIHMPYRSHAIENGVDIMNKNDTLLILGKGNENYLSMGLGKERYAGDKHYAVQYMNERKEEENETI